MTISWTRLPFKARTEQEYSKALNDWLSWVFYDELPRHGFEVREEQIYTSFRIARALQTGKPLFAEAGPGTGKTFAYLLPAICHARLKGKPVVIASATSVLQAQLTRPEGDIQTLSKLLGLDVDVRLAGDPAEYLCEWKAEKLGANPREGEEWERLREWAQRTNTGARTEVPFAADDLWRKVAWDPGLPCDTCERRGHCHVMMARRHYRAAADLIVCDHRLFSLDLLTRQERHDAGELPLLPAYSGVIADEGHHLPETWQRAGGYFLSRPSLAETLERVEEFAHRPSVARAYTAVQRFGAAFFKEAFAAAEPGEGKRHLPVNEELLTLLNQFDKAVESLQDGLVTEEAMSEGQAWELEIRAYQDRLDRLRSGLWLLKAPEAVRWVEGKEIWVVPQKPSPLFARGRLTEGLPLIVTSATLEPEYQARVLHLRAADSAVVGVPFDLGEQSLVYQPEAVQASTDGPVGPDGGNPVAEAVALLHATKGRAIILLPSLAEVAQWKQALNAYDLPWPIYYEGEGERGAQLERFKSEINSVLVGASFWEGVDVPGEALSCVIIPRLPFPAHDPLVRERRRQADEAGLDPFEAVDLPEMLILLKQGLGRLIRTAADRGVLAILDRSWVNEEWADLVIDALPEDAERTDELEAVQSFLNQ